MGQIAAVAMDLVDFSRISAKKLKKNGILCFFGWCVFLLKFCVEKQKMCFFWWPRALRAHPRSPRSVTYGSPRSPALIPRSQKTLKERNEQVIQVGLAKPAKSRRNYGTGRLGRTFQECLAIWTRISGLFLEFSWVLNDPTWKALDVSSFCKISRFSSLAMPFRTKSKSCETQILESVQKAIIKAASASETLLTLRF